MSIIEAIRARILAECEADGSLVSGCARCERAAGYEDPRQGQERYGRHPEHVPTPEWQAYNARTAMLYRQDARP